MAYINGKRISFPSQVTISEGSACECISEWDLKITDLSNLNFNFISHNVGENARVFVAVHFTESTTFNLDMPNKVRLIDFGGCTYGENCNIRVSGGNATHIRNLYLNNANSFGDLTIFGMDGVEHCGCDWHDELQASQVTINIESCRNISDCVATNITDCDMITNCYLGGQQLAQMQGCRNITNVVIYGDFEALIDNCEHISNVRRMYNSATITYSNCTYVDADTCDGYYTEEDSGKAILASTDGGKNLLKVVSYSEFAQTRDELEQEDVILKSRIEDNEERDAVLDSAINGLKSRVNTAESRIEDNEEHIQHIEEDMDAFVTKLGDISTILTALHEGGIQ